MLRTPISDTIFRFTEVRDVTNREDVSQAAILDGATRRELDTVTARRITVFSREMGLSVSGGRGVLVLHRMISQRPRRRVTIGRAGGLRATIR